MDDGLPRPATVTSLIREEDYVQIPYLIRYLISLRNELTIEELQFLVKYLFLVGADYASAEEMGIVHDSLILALRKRATPPSERKSSRRTSGEVVLGIAGSSAQNGASR